ncbi:MAG: UDP-N-acetylglucosamine--N-acetylmuramyl-(pentapeptide) pyrophosphoryl-undecaprenol N-acetylglucosamine transferase [Armatimonadetes bacterium]|nr:UDP-N-acetylglucosamine--N-acetylmuramyl-(pentapeptide) pyrophosphoryl-undecaprenol N-acetylglucosamine transferase [Armatimonadota bacterium]
MAPKDTAIRIALVGGGTGGHIFPALAVAHELRRLRPSVQPWLAIGRRRAEAEWAADADLIPVRLFAAPMPYGFRPLALLKAGVAALAGTMQAWLWWTGWRPAVVLTFGGYVSVPAALAARRKRIPYIFHASDCLPDRAARLLGRHAAMITVNYAESAQHFEGVRVEVVGQPIRPWLLGADRRQAARNLALDPDRLTILVIGGSQGARSINYAAINAARAILESSEAQILHLCGNLDYDDLSQICVTEQLPIERYRLLAFLREMEWALALADVAVTRAGANGLAELAAAGVPSLIVPYPHAGAHQRHNAEPIAKAGAGIIVADEELDGDRLAAEVLGLVTDEQRRREMAAAAKRWARPEAAAKVAGLLLEIAEENS